MAALAVVVSDATSQHAFMFRKRINTLDIPCQLFEDEESAADWLKSLDD